MEHAEVLAYGEFAGPEQVALEEAAHDSAVRLYTTASRDQALQWLELHSMIAVLLGEGEAQEGLALGARAQSRLRRLPILALTTDPSDLDFASAYSWGADDVVAPRSAWSLTTRLRALTNAENPLETPRRGAAIVAEQDVQRRVACARALFNAGYDVRFAVSEEDASAYLLETRAELLVISTDIAADALQLIARARAAGSKAKIVVSAGPRQYNELSQALARSLDARVTDASSPPENVVFLANELSALAVLNQRKRPRILHGTTVRFRGEGREEDELGFSYNVSVGGLYVRTLAPPQDDTVWLELVPPKSSRRVRLVGSVVWRRPFGPHGNSLVPPGFGVRIKDATHDDHECWLAGCAAAAADVLTESLLPPRSA